MAQNKKQQITTSARGGPVRLTLGCVLIAIGFGWALGLLANTSVFKTLRFFCDTAHGLGGTLCSLLPFFALWGGALLCVSAKHKVTVRAYVIVLLMYWLLLAIVTLWSKAGGQPLMVFIANGNKSALYINDNTTFGAYLTGAYHLRSFNNGMLAGGGLLGMLIACPLYKTNFASAGSAFILCALELVLLLVLLRFNPFEAWRTVNVRRAERAAQQSGEEQEEMPPEPVYRPVQMQPLIPQQQVTYSRETSVQSDVQESYLVPEQPRYESYEDRSTPESRGFVPVQTDVLYEEHIPVGDDYKPVREEKKKAAGRRSARHVKQEAEAEQPAQTVQVEMSLPVKEEAPPREMVYAEPEVQQQTFDAPRVKVSEAKVSQPATERKAPAAVRGGSHVTGEVKQVYTDPAVDMAGKRIPINPRSEEVPRIDPFEQKHTREAMRTIDSEYAKPSLRMLNEPERNLTNYAEEDEERARLLEKTLASFSIEAKVQYVIHGPAITRFALRLADGINVNRLNNITKNLAMAMQSTGLRTEIPIPNTSLVGIEVPNRKVSKVTFKEVLDSDQMRNNPSPTAVAIGKDITGTPIICELSKMPHLLIAGATGSGKSVCINAIIMSILYRATPQQVRLLMIDPKMVELQPYNGIPHLLTEVVSDPKKAAAALDWVVQEMGERYRKFQQTGARNIEGYNKKISSESDRMPDIVVIIDEFSDLMVQCRKQVEESIQRLAALARAAGIYMIVATQRPSVDVITGIIKANIPSRIAFAVANNVDSRTIIDSVGAEKLLGKGDMLYYPREEFVPIRVQGCFVSDEEVADVTEYIKANNTAEYDDRVDEHMERAAIEEMEASMAANNHQNDPEYQTNTENELLQRAIEMAIESGQMSISMLRRRLGLGHSRAGKLIDKLANMGIVSQDEGPKPRRTLITREDYAKMQAQILDE